MNLFIMMYQSDGHNIKGTKQIILSLAVFFILFVAIYLLWQTFYNIPSNQS